MTIITLGGPAMESAQTAHDAMVLDLVLSARHGMRLIDYYPTSHELEGRAIVRERLADLVTLGEDELVRDLLASLARMGIKRPL